MQRLFIIAWSAVVIVVVGLMVLLDVSLIPHFGQIGNVVFVVLCIFLGYGVILGGVKTYSWTGIMLSQYRRAKNHERLLSAPADHHSIYLQEIQPRYSIHEVSANVAAASVPRTLPAPQGEIVDPGLNEGEVIRTYQLGLSIKDTAKQHQGTEYEVRKILHKAGVVREK